MSMPPGPAPAWPGGPRRRRRASAGRRRGSRSRAPPCCAAAGCIEIRHNGEVYRLQATRLGKLILTK